MLIFDYRNCLVANWCRYYGNHIKPLNTMKRGVGILSPDKSMHLDIKK